MSSPAFSRSHSSTSSSSETAVAIISPSIETSRDILSPPVMSSARRATGAAAGGAFLAVKGPQLPSRDGGRAVAAFPPAFVGCHEGKAGCESS